MEESSGKGEKKRHAWETGHSDSLVGFAALAFDLLRKRKGELMDVWLHPRCNDLIFIVCPFRVMPTLKIIFSNYLCCLIKILLCDAAPRDKNSGNDFQIRKVFGFKSRMSRRRIKKDRWSLCPRMRLGPGHQRHIYHTLLFVCLSQVIWRGLIWYRRTSIKCL